LLCSPIHRGSNRAGVVLIALNDGKGSVLLFASPTVAAAAAVATTAGIGRRKRRRRRRRRRNWSEDGAPKGLKNFLHEIAWVYVGSSKCPLGDTGERFGQATDISRVVRRVRQSAKVGPTASCSLWEVYFLLSHPCLDRRARLCLKELAAHQRPSVS
jgi:hypothetical protein